eukprot:11255420-Alexandrium_andersonii.AAC.1
MRREPVTPSSCPGVGGAPAAAVGPPRGARSAGRQAACLAARAGGDRPQGAAERTARGPSRGLLRALAWPPL